GPSTTSLMHPTGRYVAVIKFGDLHLLTCQPYGKPGRARACSEKRITTEGAWDPKWQMNGKVLEWSFGNTYHSMPLSALIATSEGVPRIHDGLQSLSSPLEVPLDFRVPYPRGHGVLALTGAKIITMRGDEVIENG